MAKPAKNRKPLSPKLPSPATLLPTVILASLLVMALGAAAYIVLKRFLPATGEADVIRIAVSALGVLTVGAVAVIQYRKHRVTEAQASYTREAQYSDRLTKAIEHLGHPDMYIRVGALYEFRRLAEESGRDREYIADIIMRFFRDKLEALVRNYSSSDKDKKKGVNLRPETDVLTAGEILKGIREKPNLQRLKVPFLDLEEIDFSGANLTNANLNGAFLRNAVLFGADLRGADLRDVNLIWANLSGTNLSGANLIWADLRSACLIDVINLTEKQLNSAIINETTELPCNLKSDAPKTEPESPEAVGSNPVSPIK